MDKLIFIVRYGLYTNLSVCKLNILVIDDVLYSITYILDGIAYSNDGHILVANVSINNIEIVMTNVNCLYTPYGYIIFNDKHVIYKSEKLSNIPSRLFLKIIELYFTYDLNTFYHKTRNLIRNSDDLSLFELDNKRIMDKSGVMVPIDYNNLHVDRESYYRLLVKYVFPYITQTIK